MKTFPFENVPKKLQLKVTEIETQIFIPENLAVGVQDNFDRTGRVTPVDMDIVSEDTTQFLRFIKMLLYVSC